MTTEQFEKFIEVFLESIRRAEMLSETDDPNFYALLQIIKEATKEGMAASNAIPDKTESN